MFQKTVPGKISVISILGLLYVLLGAPSKATEVINTPNIRFQHELNDLSQATGSGILQDKEGFFWIGLQGGLLKWDGKRREVFTPHNSGLTSQMITSLIEGRNGRIWIATLGGGLLHYNKQSNQFTAYRHDPNDPTSISNDALGSTRRMQSLAEDNEGHIWVASETGGLNRLDPATGVFTKYPREDKENEGLSTYQINAVYADRKGEVWIGSETGLHLYDRNRDTFMSYVHKSNEPKSLGGKSVLSIFEDQQGVIWVGTAHSGLDKFTSETGEFVHYRMQKDNSHSLAKNKVVAIAEDNQGRLWMTHSGREVSLLNKKRDTFTRFTSNTNKPFALQGNDLDGLYVDKRGFVWIVANNGKINKYDPNSYRFSLYLHEPKNPKTIPSNNINRTFIDRKGNLLFASVGSRVSRYNPETNDFTAVSLPGKKQSAFLEDSSGNHWLACTTEKSPANVLFKLDPSTMDVIHTYPMPKGEVSTTIIEDALDPNILWFTTWAHGLGKFIKNSGQFTFFSHDPHDPDSIGGNSVWELVVDKNTPHILWLGIPGNGMNSFDTRTEIFTRYEHEPQDHQSIALGDVYAIAQTSKGEFWLTTYGGGINKFDKQKGTFERYDVTNGRFPDNNGVNLLEDDTGILWIGAPGAIIKFNPKTGEYKEFGQAGGVQGGASWAGAAVKAFDGRIWLGGGEGLNAFYPEKIQVSMFNPLVFFTSFTQGGEPFDLEKAPEKTQMLHLDWRKNYFEFEVAALDFAHPAKNRYKYILEGWDKDWYPAGSRNHGRYSGLPGGTYLLRARGTNSDGSWSLEEAKVKVIVTFAFWQTLAFKIGSGVGSLGIIVVFIANRFRVNETNRRHLTLLVDERTKELGESNEELRQAKEKSDSANKEKSIFLANMSHELRTPLNAILGFTDVLKRKNSSSNNEWEELGIIAQSGDHLLALINDILDIAKIEAGKMELHPEPINLSLFLSTVVGLLRRRAQDKGVDLIYKKQLRDNIGVELDSTRLRQVLINLIGNGIKFTENGSVTLEVQQLENTDKELGEDDIAFTFKVADTGLGISKTDIHKIFLPFEQVDYSGVREGSGLGLSISQQIVALMGGKITATSEQGKGSCFEFNLRLPAVTLTFEDKDKGNTKRTGYLGLPKKILVVDDIEINRQLLCTMLEPLGFHVITAVDGNDGVRKALHEKPDLILMDLVMPNKNGFEAIEELQSYPEMNSPIISVSASIVEKGQINSLDAGSIGFLLKPVKRKQLLSLLEHHLGFKWEHSMEMKDEPEVVPALPKDILNKLYQIAQQGNMHHLRKHLDGLLQKYPDNVGYLDQLRTLVKRYQVKQLLALLKSDIEKGEDSI